MLLQSILVRLRTPALCAALVIVCAQCGGDGSTSPDNVVVGVRIDPLSTPLRLGSEMQLHATAINSASAAVAGDISFSSSDASVLSVSRSGLLRALNVGSSTVSAQAGSVQGSITLTVVSGNPALLSRLTGNNVIATVQTAVNPSPSVSVTDSVGNLVEGVPVTFAVGSGGGSIASAVVTSNAAGIATAGAWTVGPVAGVNTLTATVDGSSGPVTTTFTATAVAAVASTLAVVTNPATAVTGVALDPQPVIEVRNAVGTLITTATNPVTISTSATGGVLGTTTVNAVGGVARFTDVALVFTGSQPLTVSSPGLEVATFIVNAAQGRQLSANDISFAASRGDTDPDGKLVLTTGSDLSGAPITSLTLAPIEYGAGATGWLHAQLLATSTPANVFVEPRQISSLEPGTYTARITVRGTNVVPAVFDVTLTIKALPPTTMVVVSEPLNGTRGAVLPTQPVIELRDSLGRIAPVTDSVTVSIRNGPGYLSGTTTVAAVGGIAKFTDLMLNSSGTFLLAFTTPRVLSVVASRPITVAPNSGVYYTSFPTTATSGVGLLPAPVVTLQNQDGGTATGFFLDIRLSLKPLGDAHGTLLGTTLILTSGPAATFNDVYIVGTPGDYLLTAAFGSITTNVIVHLR